MAGYEMTVSDLRFPPWAGQGMLRSKSQTQYFENHIFHPLELCYKDF